MYPIFGGIGFVKTFFGKISFNMFYLKLDFGRATINMLVPKMLSNISIYKFVNAFQIIWCVAGRSSPSINISIVRKCQEVSLSATDRHSGFRRSGFGRSGLDVRGLDVRG